MEVIFKLLKEIESKEDSRIYTKPVAVNDKVEPDEKIKGLMDSQLRLYGIRKWNLKVGLILIIKYNDCICSLMEIQIELVIL